jgi:DNA-binding NarL/FixJ family response regulator
MPDDLRRPRVLFADDQVFLHRLMARLLEPTCEVLGAVSDMSELTAAIERLQPDVVVIDLNMPKLSGIEACRRIRAATPSVKVIILTADVDPGLKERALEVGASGFVSKMRAAEDLAAAVHDAVAG